MRNRETEWSLPMVRFFGAFFIPPLCSTLILTISTLLTRDYGPALFATFLGSLMFSAAPSVFWFVSMEKIYERSERIRKSRNRFTLIGASLGAVFTIALFLLILTISGGFSDLGYIFNPPYVLIGLVSGYATSHAIFPTNKDKPNQAAHTTPASAPR
ncbi:hypothetical protein [Pelagicoccus sp. SDUM812003]|uniref:hypothetical protein n=1 Tax=Pelagicoccus sp. SDUM812003 TaxID=3041267 RepID=UPI00280CFB33|nr:hypothetical protein [Pelagicoccus sp. SDUM812003]MDQ8205871.1 hypothetical protein [Pelagicoccus sp. SDUM812003]